MFPAKIKQVFRYFPFTVDVSSAAFPCIQSENSADSSGSRQSLERWEDSDVRFADHNVACKI